MVLQVTFTPAHARRFFYALICVDVLFQVLCTTSTLVGEPSRVFQRWISLNEEANIPTWFSSSQLLMVAGALAVAALYGNLSRGPSRKLLYALSAVFAFFSMDDTAMIHEGTNTILSQYPWLPAFKHGKGFWILPYLCIGTGVFLFIRRDLLAMWKRFRLEGFLIAGGFAISVIGAAGLEAFGYQFLTRHGSGVWIYRIEEAIEDAMELGGETISLYGALLLAIKLLSVTDTRPAAQQARELASAPERQGAPISAG